MNIQEMYDSLTPLESEQFARDNKELIASHLLDADSICLAGYNKDELLKALEGWDIDRILYGAIAGGMDVNDAKTWLERQMME